MLTLLRPILRGLGLDTRKVYQALSAASLDAAARAQKLDGLIADLRGVVPDLRDQYTYDFDPEEYTRYWEPKMRGLHAFQVQLALAAIEAVGRDQVTIADVGDSSGTHGMYLKALDQRNRIQRFLSVNLDPVAVEKVRSRGGEAILCRAEELDHESIDPDLYLSFETVEHLSDPVTFLHNLAVKGSGTHAAITVPYRRDSRFGGGLIRQSLDSMPEVLTAEQVHIFEFNPADWQLLAYFSGWKTIGVQIYKQYPTAPHPLAAMAPLWRKLDFEGFLGLILQRDTTLANRYRDW